MQRNDNNHNNNDKGSNESASNDGVLKVGEREFRKTKFGLAEEEVRSYVQELITQRDALIKRQEHLAALTELAEKTVIEANNLSQLMMKKSTEQARAEGDKIRVQTELECKQIIEAKKAEAKGAAEKEGLAIMAEAQSRAKLIREEHLNTIKVEAATLAQKLQGELIANIDSIKQQVLSIGSKFEPSARFNHEASPRVNEKSLEASAPMLTPNEKGVLLNHIPWLEVEILPPLDIEKIMDLISCLESLPEVKTTDLLPETPNPLIRIFLNEPSPLVELLRTLPQIAHINELTDFAEHDSETEEKRERIQIVLGKNPNIKDKEAKKGTTSKSN
jgi:F0F1-type ATP synthase membrane subunit b/b'